VVAQDLLRSSLPTCIVNFRTTAAQQCSMVTGALVKPPRRAPSFPMSDWTQVTQLNDVRLMSIDEVSVAKASYWEDQHTLGKFITIRTIPSSCLGVN
jgi:hypothetical protein